MWDSFFGCRSTNCKPDFFCVPRRCSQACEFEPQDPSATPAGFDAHKKDEINFRYIGVTERDYEWLTEQLVAVANRCERTIWLDGPFPWCRGG